MQPLVKPFVAMLLLALSSVGCRPQTSVGQGNSALSRIHRVLLVVLENTDYEAEIRQPFIQSLIPSGALLSNYRAIVHPSQPNYIAMVAGGTFNVSGNDMVDLPLRHLGDVIESAGKTWKSYAEAYPGQCFLGESSGAYRRRHVPFISFTNVQRNPARCARVTDEHEFERDLAGGTLPDFSFYTPDMNNNGHDTGVAFADRWLRGFFERLRSNPRIFEDTLVIVTSDEDDGVGTDNQVATILVGAGVNPGTISNQPYTHYSLLKTIEKILGVQSLGLSDERATEINDIWLKN